MELLSLAGSWTLKPREGQVLPVETIEQKRLGSVPAEIPGDIMSALLSAGLISDPYSGTNELGIQWVGETDWILGRDFNVSSSLFACKRIFLAIDLLDTVAEVYINGRLAGKNDNMFVPCRWDVQDYLREGRNHIEAIIFSPVKAAAKKAATLPYPVPESVYPVSSPHRNLLRKAQCMSGWDWGPCLMTGGIYDGIALCGIDGPRIESVQTRMKAVQPGTDRDFQWPATADAFASQAPEQESEKNQGYSRPDFAVTVTVEANSAEAMDAVLGISLAGSSIERHIQLPAGDSIVVERFMVSQPELWWPAESGKQSLYELVVRLGPGEIAPCGPLGAQAQCHEERKRIGFRELRVSTEKDSAGREMSFTVNGRRVFAKGANWVPADALPSRWTRARLSRLLQDATQAHMNCLRVWGGGRYESDVFYDLCDEYGIMIWQDCMFSCALYPSDARFLANVENEIRHQVRRLSDHPCLALWCGNNEALGAIAWYSESRENPARYKKDYELLTYGVLGKVIQELDPDRCWWPSSPSAGPDDFSDNWHSDDSGDMHFWSVWHEAKPFSEYLRVRPRFCSEFGFQSYPSAATIASFAPAAERHFGSTAMEFHQRDPKGNKLIGDTLARYFRKPKGFRETLYLSQVQQALAIKTAVEYWRACKPRCMGTLYWQLNDVWPATSWSGIEYSGAWKLLHYEARRFYDPLIISIFCDGTTIRLYAVSDMPIGYRISCTVRFRDFEGSVLAQSHVQCELAADESRQLWSLPMADLPESPQECFVEAGLEAWPESSGRPGVNGGRSDYGGRLDRSSLLLLSEPKNCSLRPAGLEVSLESGKAPIAGEPAAPRYIITARDAPAFFVQLSDETGLRSFSDAGFHLAAGESRSLSVWRSELPPEPEAVPIDDLRLFDLESSCEN